MEIVCPKCKKENVIEVKGGTKCQHCEEGLDRYRFIKTAVSSILITGFLTGGAVAAYQKVKEEYSDKRYPIEWEYALTDSCTSSDMTLLLGVDASIKQKTCLCAVQMAENEIPLSDWTIGDKESVEKLRSQFRGYVLECYENKKGRKP